MRRWWPAGVILLFCIDRLVKNIVWFQEIRSDWGGFIVPTLNRNIAFSIKIPGLSLDVLVIVLLIICLILLWQTVRLYRQNSLVAVWWGYIVAGAVSNLLDRITLGGVFDYLHIGFWPVFNLSDVYISLGVAGILWNEAKLYRQAKKIATTSKTHP